MGQHETGMWPVGGANIYANPPLLQHQLRESENCNRPRHVRVAKGKHSTFLEDPARNLLLESIAISIRPIDPQQPRPDQNGAVQSGWIRYRYGGMFHSREHFR